MSEIAHAPVSGSAFEDLAARVEWAHPGIESHLRVASELGWLVLLNHMYSGVHQLVGFSVESPQTDGDLYPPATADEAALRLGPHAKMLGLRGTFNSDFLAKGLGSVITNTPQALPPHSIRNEIAVRSVEFTSMDDLYRRDETEASVPPQRLALGHGLRLIRAMFGDTVRGGNTGSERAARDMEAGYGHHRFVMLPLPPAWRVQQQQRGVHHKITPQAVLVRGGAFASGNVMHRLGGFPGNAR